MSQVLSAARLYVFELRLSVVPVSGKKPVGKWSEFRDRFPTDRELRNWFRNSTLNIGLVCGALSNTTVLDADSDTAEQFIYEHTETDRVVETGRGRIHAHFNFFDFPNRVNLFGVGLDVRSEGALAVLPPSHHANGQEYSWIQLGDRGSFDVSLLPPTKSAVVINDVSRLNHCDAVEHTVRYLEKLPPAISGQFGHGKMFRAACVIHERLRHLMMPEEALPVLQMFNTRCQPPFSEQECLHKLREAWKRKV